MPKKFSTKSKNNIKKVQKTSCLISKANIQHSREPKSSQNLEFRGYSQSFRTYIGRKQLVLLQFTPHPSIEGGKFEILQNFQKIQDCLIFFYKQVKRSQNSSNILMQEFQGQIKPRILQMLETGILRDFQLLRIVLRSTFPGILFRFLRIFRNCWLYACSGF